MGVYERGFSNKVVKEKLSSVVTLEQAKNQLNVEEDFTEDDTHILFLIDTATGLAEDYTGTDISFTKNTLELFNFQGTVIRLEEHPFHSMDSITIYDKDDNETVLTEDEYFIQKRYSYFVIVFLDSDGNRKSIEAKRMVLVFFTGYEPDEAPFQISSAILVKVNDLYDVERTTYTIGANFRDNGTFERLLNGHVINRW